MDTAIIEKARETARIYSGDYLNDLIGQAEGTFLDGVDKFNVRLNLENMLGTSIAYTVLTRCGYDASLYFKNDDFRGIHEFNSLETMSILGNATSDLSEQILQDCIADVKYLQSRAGKQAIVDTHVEGIIEFLESI